MAREKIRWVDVLTNGRVAAAMTLGFASGLPFNLPQGTLQAWLASADVDLETIGWFTLVAAPYTFKFLWAPILDRYALPMLDRRRGWILLFQLILAGTIALLGLQAPHDAIYMMAGLALVLAAASASQDVVIDAYRTDTLRPEERGLGSTAVQLGWRVAALISGALALVLGDTIGWRNAYLLMAALMGICTLFTYFAPTIERPVAPPRTLAAAVIDPLREFLTRPGALALMALIVLYKFGDAFALSLSTAFLIKGVGFSAAEVGAVAKTVNITTTIVGTIVGGLIFVRLGLFWSLLAFGAVQATTNLMYALLAAVGKDMPTMIAAVGFDNFAGGMGAAAFGALIMALCNIRYSAFQFALLSALSAVARNFLGPPAAGLVNEIGWGPFFVVTFFTALPGLLILWLVRERVRALDTRP